MVNGCYPQNFFTDPSRMHRWTRTDGDPRSLGIYIFRKNTFLRALINALKIETNPPSTLARSGRWSHDISTDICNIFTTLSCYNYYKQTDNGAVNTTWRRSNERCER